MDNHQFHLIREIWQGINVIRHFKPAVMTSWRGEITAHKILLTGEGSSRIFPAYNAVRYAKKIQSPLHIETMGAREAAQYDWHNSGIIAASNSGKTKETIAFLSSCQGKNIKTYALTAHADSPMTKTATKSYILTSGIEKAVAATQSVIEQALCYQALLTEMDWSLQTKAADFCRDIMVRPLDASLISYLTSAQNIYWCGPKDGVCEELALKTIEILRKTSFYLEGTLALHGIEEILSTDDALIIYHPHADDIALYQKYLAQHIGAKLIIIAHEPYDDKTLIIPRCHGFDGYLGLVQGWRLLIEAGLKLGINLDEPKRARKIGNALDDTGAKTS
jgi:glucosamine--fructose-6-phosphate aminotransferase (isomerizing)